MKFLPLLLANLTRKKIRTTLTIGSFAVAMFLFGLLVAVRAGFRQGIDIAGADRLVVVGRTGLIQPLPLPYQERIRRLPGIADVTHATWFGGHLPGPEELLRAVRDRARGVAAPLPGVQGGGIPVARRTWRTGRASWSAPSSRSASGGRWATASR